MLFNLTLLKGTLLSWMMTSTDVCCFGQFLTQSTFKPFQSQNDSQQSNSNNQTTLNNSKRKRKLAKPKKISKRNDADNVQDTTRKVWVHRVFFFFNFIFFNYLPLPNSALCFLRVILYAWYCRILRSLVRLKTQKNKERGPSVVSPVVENGDSFEMTSIHRSYLKDGSVQWTKVRHCSHCKSPVE